MTTNPLIASFAGEPVLIEPSQIERVQICLDGAVAIEGFSELCMAGPDEFWDRELEWVRPYNVDANGILQIPVRGMLMHNLPFQLFGFATGYDYIRKAFERGMADSNVSAVAFLIDSPGGVVATLYDTIDKMIGMKSKPVRAFAHESAYSAAYALATVADHIAVSRTGAVGSIGTKVAHVDMSAAMEQRGIRITEIASDPSKIDGGPYAPLSDEARERLQARIGEINEFFVSAVARGRGLEEAFIRDEIKAHSYTAKQAVANGLADSIGSLDDAIAAFAASLDDQSDNPGEDPMAENNQPNESAVDQAAVETARAEGIAAERARISAILDSDEAEGRETLARHFAFNTDMAPEAAVAALNVSEKKVPAAPQSQGEGFAAAMANGNPEVDAEGHGNDDDGEDDPVASTLALAKQAGLKGF